MQEEAELFKEKIRKMKEIEIMIQKERETLKLEDQRKKLEKLK